MQRGGASVSVLLRATKGINRRLPCRSQVQQGCRRALLPCCRYARLPHLALPVRQRCACHTGADHNEVPHLSRQACVQA